MRRARPRGLELPDRARADASARASHALLNITDDHLDRYPSFDAYAAAKGNPFVQQTADDVAVVPTGDARVPARGRGAATAASSPSAPGGGRRRRAEATSSSIGARRALSARRSSRLRGAHNVDERLRRDRLRVARLGAAHEQAIAARRSRASRGSPHRTVLVAEIDGVRYYDDSKGTNVGASVAALRGLAEPRVGAHRRRPRQARRATRRSSTALREKGRALVVIGEAADRIAEAAAGVVPDRARGVDGRRRRSWPRASPGPATPCCSSPACSSFDMFRDYKDRGDVFVEAVRALATAPEQGAAR